MGTPQKDICFENTQSLHRIPKATGMVDRAYDERMGWVKWSEFFVCFC